MIYKTFSKTTALSFLSLKCGEIFFVFLMVFIQPCLNPSFSLFLVIADLWEETKLIEPVEVVTRDTFFLFKELAVFFIGIFTAEIIQNKGE